MKLKKLTILNFKRTALTGIKEVIYEPITKYQMLLGPNGSGKTSIINETSPFPPVLKKKFNTGGGKHIVLTNNGKTFELKSGMELGNKHSFSIDGGPNLNEGGTFKIQVELVEEYFGITSKINEMMLGNSKFTKMSSVDRKYWLTKLDTLDYEYITREYNFHRSRLRDIKGALKVNISSKTSTDELLLESEKLILQEEIDKLKARKDMLNQTLGMYSTNTVPKNNMNMELLNSSNNKLSDITSMILDDSESLDDVIEEHSRCVRDLRNVSNSLASCNEDLLKAESQDEASKIDIGPLRNELNELEAELKHLDNMNQYGVPTEDICLIIGPMETMVNRVGQLINDLVIMNITDIPDDIASMLVDAKKQYTLANKIIMDLELERTHLIQHKDDESITCPQCNNIFKVDELLSLDELVAKIDVANRNKDIREETLASVEEMMDFHLKRIETIRNIQSAMEETRFKPYVFSMYDDLEIDLDKCPNDVKRGLERLLSDIRVFQKYDVLKNRYASLTSDLNKHILIKKELDDLKICSDSIVEIRSKIELLKQEHRHLTTTLGMITSRKDILTSLRHEIMNNRDIRKSIFADIHRNMDEIEKVTIRDLIAITNTEIDLRHKRIIEDDKLLEVINSEDLVIEGLSSELTNLGMLVDSLSPSKGMIGDAIRSFLNTYLTKVNKVISDMWNFDIVVMPCNTNESGTLDYNFPVHINGVEALKDISEGSKGMLEIFNLAFRLVTLDMLGLGRYPIYLDEFAVNMDTMHRNKAFRLLETLASKHTNVYMISHFLEFYGGINNMDISVMSDQNMDLDGIGKFNKVMKIRR